MFAASAVTSEAAPAEEAATSARLRGATPYSMLRFRV